MLTNIKSSGIVLIRIFLGITMFVHGFSKLTNLSGTESFFTSLGLPAFMAILVGLIEVIGGVMMVVGLFIPLVALAFTGILLGAIFTSKLKLGFLNGFEYELFLAVTSFGVGLNYLSKKIFQFTPSK